MLTRDDVLEMERELERAYGVVGTYTRQQVGNVYFVREENGPVKIGWGAKPRRRMAAMQSGNPRRLHLLAYFPATRSVERDLHERFSDLRLSGEWFQPHPALLDYIDTLGIPDED